MIVDLPAPSAAELAHSERLMALLQAELSREAFMPFSRFMQLALYQPGLGYYAAGAQKFGAEGDFITAPELSPLFSRTLARQVAEPLQELSGGEILELGAGSGRMALELLLELERLGQLPSRYRILELSAELRRRQRQTIEARAPQLLEHMEWLESWPQAFEGVVLANELLDAMPVERFRISESGIEQQGLCWQEGLKECYRPAPAELQQAVIHLQQDCGTVLPVGYRSEINRQLSGWFAALAEVVRRGVVILVDYGYPRREFYLPERDDGTLTCFYRHRSHADSYRLVGLQDITASVDFTAVIEAATEAGFELDGFTSQANFLFNNDLQGVLAEASEDADQRTLLQLSQQVKQLTLPAEMGERFKVMGLSMGEMNPLRGFGFNDQSSRL